jgi:hypothetical protein
MPIGICKLCLQQRELRDSHYIPASLYRRIKKLAGADPVVMTPTFVMSTSRQIHDYVFCGDCEDRLNVGGEKYLHAISANGRSFPLRDMLASGRPTPLGPHLRYSGRQIGLDVQKLVYFAVSMVWRGGVHPWRTIDRQTSQLAVGSHMEEMRRFLMGEIPLPREIGLLVIVCLDFASQIHTLAPFLVGGEQTDTLFEMLMLGITLRVGINHPEQEFYALCCTHTSDNGIVVGNCKPATVGAVEDFHIKARHAANVKKIEAQFKARK